MVNSKKYFLLKLYVDIFIEEAERLLAIDSLIEENDDDDDDNNSSQTTVADPGETLIRIASHSVHTRGEEEHGMKYLFK